MSSFNRAGPVYRARINHLEISALFKNTAKNQNLSYEKKPLNQDLTFFNGDPGKAA